MSVYEWTRILHITKKKIMWQALSEAILKFRRYQCGADSAFSLFSSGVIPQTNTESLFASIMPELAKCSLDLSQFGVRRQLSTTGLSNSRGRIDSLVFSTITA